MRANDEPGYVMRRQDYGDTSLLVDVFTRTQGRFRIVAKGARTGKGPRARLLQPFSRMILGWSGRSDLKTLTQLESAGSLHLGKDAMICGFYINELLWNFLEVQDPHEELFDQYETTLQSLSLGNDLEPVLRDFEFFLLKDIGYETCFDLDADTGEPIDPREHYLFELEKGLIETLDRNKGALGEQFLAIANRDFSEKSVRSLAKRLTRQLISHRMNGKELHSRKWFMSGKKKLAESDG